MGSHRNSRLLLVLTLAGIGLAAVVWWLWPREPRAEMLRALPQDPALLVHIDFEAFRSSSAAMLAGIAWESKQGQTLAQGLQGARLASLALSVDEQGIYVVTRGELSEPHVQWLRKSLAGDCPDPAGESPCTGAGPGEWTLRVGLREEGLLTAAYSPSPGADAEMARRLVALHERLRGEASFFREGQAEGPVARVVMKTGRLESVARALPFSVPSLSFLSRVLEKAASGEFTLAADGKQRVLLRLEAQAATESEAEELRLSLADLNEFAAAAADFGRGEADRSAWGKVLQSGRFERNATKVNGNWTADEETLKQLAAD